MGKIEYAVIERTSPTSDSGHVVALVDAELNLIRGSQDAVEKYRSCGYWNYYTTMWNGEEIGDCYCPSTDPELPPENHRNPPGMDAEFKAFLLTVLQNRYAETETHRFRAERTGKSVDGAEMVEIYMIARKSPWDSWDFVAPLFVVYENGEPVGICDAVLQDMEEFV